MINVNDQQRELLGSAHQKLTQRVTTQQGQEPAVLRVLPSVVRLEGVLSCGSLPARAHGDQAR